MPSRRGAGSLSMVVAVAVALILVAIALMISGGKGSSTPERRTAAEDIPDIPSLTGPAPDLREQQPIGATTNARLTLKDRNDPSRIAWEIESAASEPIPGTDRYELTEPKARYYIDRDTVILISADRASFVMPDVAGEPESGRFEGSVELVQMARDGDGPSDVRVTTPWIEFDAVAGEIGTTERLVIEGERIIAECMGFSAVLNEVEERLEFFESPGGIIATITPASAADERTPESEPTAAGETDRPRRATRADEGSDAGSEAENAEPPTVQFYAATLAGDVVVSQPARRITSDRARVWLRLEDNAIAGDTFSAHPGSVVAPVEASLLAMALAAQADQPAGDDMGFDAPIELRCTGAVTVIPMQDRPAPLGSGDEMALRFEVDAGNRVQFEDDELQAIGDADLIEYGFTNKLLTMQGSPEAPARAMVAGSGTLIAENLALGLSTGIGQSKGPGRLDAEGADRAVAWQDQADVVFRVRDGWMTGSLEQAIASGGVELRDGSSVVTAEDLNARFAEDDDRSPIERVVLAGTVAATTETGTLNADRVDVRFDVTDGESVPRLAIATGSVRGEQTDAQGGQRIWADQIEADLAEDERGEIGVVSARAREAVRYEQSDGTYAVGDSASIATATRTAVIEGLPGVVASGGATIEAERIELDDDTGTIHTPGRGRLTMNDEKTGGPRLLATWTESMRFSDATGQLETVGGIEIVSTPSPLQRDTFRGERLVAIVESIDASDEEAATGVLGGSRRLVSAVATGSTDQRASAEFLRFAAPGDDEPVRVTAIVGETIEADNAAGVLRVPTPGRLVVSDTRTSTDDASDGLGTGRGAALFDWEGSMLLDRPAGIARMDRRVRLVHRPLGGGSSVELESERLDASFASEDAARLTDASDRSELLGVDAIGAVWARSGEQQMLSDRMNYDPSSGLSRATAADGGWVTLFSTNRSTPITAAELEWNLESGRIDVIRPSPVAVPR